MVLYFFRDFGTLSRFFPGSILLGQVCGFTSDKSMPSGIYLNCNMSLKLIFPVETGHNLDFKRIDRIFGIFFYLVTTRRGLIFYGRTIKIFLYEGNFSRSIVRRIES